MQGQLFTQDFLHRGIADTPPWKSLSDSSFEAFVAQLRSIYTAVQAGAASTINEAQTESLIIHKVLTALGWGDDTLPQVNADPKGRESVPDLLLFASPAHKTAALAETKDDRRYRHGLAILEAKRWLRPLDRGDNAERFDPDAPSSQMLRYLSRVDGASDRAIQWGLLTNGAVWRLYWQGARSRAEEFFEIDVASALDLPGIVRDPDDAAPLHALKLFYVFFGRAAFLPQDWDSTQRTLHAYALNEARLYEEKVSQDLGARVFQDIFPQLADALARGDLHAQTQQVGYGQFIRPQYTTAYLDEVREAALVLLYRLLFLFYAEDRNLLPVRDVRYRDYSVRILREDVRDKVDAGTRFSSTLSKIWFNLQGVFILIDKGDDDVGMPAYNGGLFDPARVPLLERTKVTDAVMAPIIDALSRRTEDLLHGWINYRDLSVAHLGSIYERLLDYSLVHEVQAADSYKDKPEINRITALPASFARKVSGSYYTHDDLVRLILRESVGLLARERMDAFASKMATWKSKKTLGTVQWHQLDGDDESRTASIDPANQMLELKICDPAMGSGHFLVALVDDLADRVLEAMATASQIVNDQPWAAYEVEKGTPWQSPVLKRIASIRRTIKTTAKNHGWAVTDAQLDDRHIVRRMILKRCIFGVDKNPMAVELAKTALWLHTFTVGAPLSFLDHHLKIGDSLHGEQLPAVQRDMQHLGALLLQSEFDRLALHAKNMEQVADLTDVDIAEAQLSKQLATEAAAQVAPIHAVLDFWRALRWLVPGWPVDKTVKLLKLFKLPADATVRDAQVKAGQHPEYSALLKLLDPSNNLVSVLAAGHLTGDDAATVFGAGSRNGFDAIIGNPPWDRIKLQEVEWFAERSPAIAAQSRAADRKKMIAALQGIKMTQTATTTPPVVDLWAQYQEATARAEQNARVLGNGKLGCGDYPLLGGGDVNLYSLFVERAQSLIAPTGMVALLTPSGIAADKGAAEFFRSISGTGRLGALFDFENRKVFFPDVHASFKFCMLLFGGLQRPFAQTRCAFYLHQLAELDDPANVLTLTATDFLRVNPNTGAAPIFRTQRDAAITLALYARHPVLVAHGGESKSMGKQPDAKVWPVKYAAMFHMTNDSHLFLKADELSGQGYKRAALNRWANTQGVEAVPLYEGKMVQMFDHRAADVVVNEANLHRAAQQEAIAQDEKTSPKRYPAPQYWVKESDVALPAELGYCLAFKDVTAPTNMRTMIAAMVPASAYGNTLPVLLPADEDAQAGYARMASLVLANFGALAFDYVARQKVQGQHLNWFVLEQLPVISPALFDQALPTKFAKALRAAQLMNGHHDHPTVTDFVLPQVLALTYTAHDMAAYAQDMGYVDAAGQVLPPIVWNAEDRRARLAALDAVFFWLYGLGADDAAYIMDTFPIVREQDTKAFGRYRTKDDVLERLALLAAP
jgi:hypothetical protein